MRENTRSWTITSINAAKELGVATSSSTVVSALLLLIKSNWMGNTIAMKNTRLVVLPLADMTRRVTIKDMEQRIYSIRQQWDESSRRKDEEIKILKEELRGQRDRLFQAETKFLRAVDLWNKWIEADKGLETKEAFVTFDTETFAELLNLLPAPAPSNL